MTSVMSRTSATERGAFAQRLDHDRGRRLTGPPTLEARAHPTVEVTLFHQPERRRHLLSLVSFQHELPNIPQDGIEIRLRLGRRVRSVSLLPSGSALPLSRQQDQVSFTVPRLETFRMLAVHHA